MRIFLYILSFILMVIGCVFSILYINLFSFGYTILEYIEFIFTNIECLVFFIGLGIYIILIWRKV